MSDDPAEARPIGGAAALQRSSFARSEDLDPVGSAGGLDGPEAQARYRRGERLDARAIAPDGRVIDRFTLRHP
jgi:hypothetical protein